MGPRPPAVTSDISGLGLGVYRVNKLNKSMLMPVRIFTPVEFAR